MKKGLAPILLLFLCTRAFAQQGDASPAFSLSVVPGISFPTTGSSALFGVGGELSLFADYRIAPLPSVHIRGGLQYGYRPLLGTLKSISVLSAAIGGAVRLSLVPWLLFEGGGSVGYFFGTYNDLSITSFNPVLSVDAGLLLPIGRFELGLRASYRNELGLYDGLSTSLGLSYELPSPPKALEMGNWSFQEIFPAFLTYYNDHPVGSVVLHNPSAESFTDIRVTFYIPAYMEGPRASPAVPALGPGESATVELLALLKPDVLAVTQATPFQCKVSVEYAAYGKPQQQSAVKEIRILDRNAVTWEDARRVAAFVTDKDPTVTDFSNSVTGVVRGKAAEAINSSLVSAVAIRSALSLYGLSYIQDPRPYERSSQNKQAVDYLKFPRETLQKKGGDCDDLSILYAALLESVGVEPAFITVPGHIFVAFALDIPPEDGRRMFSYPEDLIFRDGNTWVPIEVTRSGPFLDAWQAGADEWREGVQQGRADFYRLSDAWRLYEPVWFTDGSTPSAARVPASEDITDAFEAEMARFAKHEIAVRESALQREIAQAPQPEKPMNALGILYGKYGLYDDARREFEQIIAKREYAPALVNLANVYYLLGQKEKALQMYQLARRARPGSSAALLGAGRVSQELGNYADAATTFEKLKQADPGLAQRFSYLGLTGDEATRSRNLSKTKEFVLWEEDD